MRRNSRLLPVFALLLIGLLATSWSGPTTRAQEATPAAVAPRAEEVDFEELEELVAFAPGVELPSPADLTVVRLGFEPEDLGIILNLEVPDAKPNRSATLLLVESGTLTVVVDVPWTVSRGAVLAEMMTTAEATGGEFAPVAEEIAGYEEVTLAAGDAVYIPPDARNAEIRNDAQEPAVSLFLVIAAAEATTEATPGP
jgi:hypothetical protein